MVEFREPSMWQTHVLVAKKKVNEMNPGDFKTVGIQAMSDGRFSVMGQFEPLKGIMDEFYKVFKDKEDLDDHFNEQLTISYPQV